MCFGKCGCGSGKHLRPVSFGLAVGLTCFIAVLIWFLWMMVHGVPPMIASMHMPPPTGWGSFVHALLGFVKGFFFGFFVALFYDLFACCLRGMCRKSDVAEGCKCGCGCCSTVDKTEIRRK